MSEKIYFNAIKVKEVQTQYGTIIKLSGKVEEIIDALRQNTNDKGYINLNLNKRAEPGKYGETHSVIVDTYQKS